MAESDTTGLAALIKQRASRPSYARMISWEILKSSGNSPPHKSIKSSGRRKNKPASNKQHDEEQRDRDTDSEESEYFSADENVPEQTSRNSDEDESVTSSSSDDDSDEMVSASLQAMKLSTGGAGERRRGLSKKQKRKRRRQGHDKSVLCYAEYTVPFQNTGSVDLSADDLRDELVSDASNVSARVPSLFDLCTKSLWSASHSHRSAAHHLLPGLVKSSMASYRQSQAFSSLQLSCLYRTLAQLESKKTDHQFEVLAAVRNVWGIGVAIKHKNGREFAKYGPALHQRASDASFVIPFTYSSQQFADVPTGRSHSESLRLAYKISLVASVMDLLVPFHMRPTRKKDKVDSTLDKEDQALVSCVNVVLTHLKQRYKSVVEEYSDRALPYLYWVRGHTKLALEQFLRLSHAATDLLEKAHHLMEAARLCQFLGNTESARRLFRQSNDVVLENPQTRGQQGDREEVNEQLLMLCANTYDQGVMSEEKALQSLSAWRYLTTATCTHPESYLAAVESVMCYHLSHLPGQSISEKLRGVLELAQTASNHAWLSRLHLSLLHAWMGDSARSIIAYCSFAGTEDTPGSEFKPDNTPNASFTPWRILVDTVTMAKKPMKPLHVVWRTQLGFFRVVRDLQVFEGDLNGKSLGLRLSPEGHLTGDLHLLLPPVRAFNLDLYTGKLILPSSPGHTYVQRAVFNSRRTVRHNQQDQQQVYTEEYSNGSFALTSLEVYSDEEGRQVHLLTTGGCRALNVHKYVAYLQLTSPSGQRTKVNLRAVARRALHKKMEKEIYQSFADNEQKLEEALKGLEYAKKHDLFIEQTSEASQIGSIVSSMSENKKRPCYRWKNRWCARMHGTLASKSGLKRYGQDFLLEVKDFVSYGNTLCVMGIMGFFRPFLLFVDISKKETFASPETYVCKSMRDKFVDTVMLDVIGRHGNTVPRANILCIRDVEAGARNQYLRFFGQGGKVLVYPNADLKFDHMQCVLGSSSYCIQKLRQSRGQVVGAQDIMPTLTEIKFEQEEPEVHVHVLDPELMEMKVVADRLLVVSKEGVRVVRPDTLLPEPLLCPPDSECQCTLSDDGTTLVVTPVRVSVLTEQRVTSPSSSPTVLVPVAVNDFLLMLALQERHSAPDSVVEMAFCVKVPGHVNEVCYIGQTPGYLISTTMHKGWSTLFYRETVCRLSPSGQLLSILPCLGPGPRDFCPVLLPPPPPSGQQGEGAGLNPSSGAAWHVYMRDGHEGIIAVRL
ncbi:uncharacterized protein [Littorina saxatilis]|uniref:Uncharacterized protein n=1 Tax=Littorina saxatilis TaxID=31220 RepID=A0AAN9B8R3_9CAEN